MRVARSRTGATNASIAPRRCCTTFSTSLTWAAAASARIAASSASSTCSAQEALPWVRKQSLAMRVVCSAAALAWLA